MLGIIRYRESLNPNPLVLLLSRQDMPGNPTAGGWSDRLVCHSIT